MPSARALLQQLRKSRADFGVAADATRRHALAELASARVTTLRALLDYHEDLLFLCAFPGSDETRRAAIVELDRFAHRWRGRAAWRAAAGNSGIAGTVSRPPLAWPLAQAWIAQEDIDLDWADVEDPAAFDALVAQLVGAAERDAYEGGDYSAREWITLARRRGERAAAWLVREASANTPRGFAAAWESAQVPVRWALGDSRRSATHARLRVMPVIRRGFRRLERPVVEHVADPLERIDLLKGSQARAVIDLARAALAVRAREVMAINYPNPAEVYLADLGEGVRLALIGVAPDHRLVLEANYGYLLLSNGVPVGYGGVSPLHRQANTGINIFDPFRGSEAAFLWAQMLRTFQTLFGVGRFVINGYQFGAGNSEAIASGAYWFYYRLGFRPSLPDNADLAANEAARLRREPGSRTRPAVLQRLARGDLYLDLADFDARDYFDEALLGRLGAAVARRIATSDAPSHRDGEAGLVRAVARDLGIHRSLATPRRRALARLLPLAALLDLARWSAQERRSLGDWLLSKGDAQQRAFAQGATAQVRFFREMSALAQKERDRPPSER